MAELPKAGAKSKSKVSNGPKNASLQYVPRQVFMLCDEDLPKTKAEGKNPEIVLPERKAEEQPQQQRSGTGNNKISESWSPLMDGILCGLPPGFAGETPKDLNGKIARVDSYINDVLYGNNDDNNNKSSSRPRRLPVFRELTE